MSGSTPTIEIFTDGTHVAVDGKSWAFTSADIDDIIASYDFAANPAPVVVGHPALDAPAYGWVSNLAREDRILVAELDQVEPAFAEAVKAGRYKKISASFYQPDQAGNPTPGKWHLKHVGFLGAAAPAVKGLRPVAFAGEIAGGTEFSFTREGSKMADDKKSPEAVAFAEAQTKLAADQAALDAEKAAIAADKKKLADDRAASIKADAAAFAESQTAAGKLTPLGKPIVAGILETLEATATVSFGEAGEMTPAAAFKRLFDSATPVVNFGEHAKTPPKGAGDAESIAAAAASFTAEQAAKGITVTADAAVRHVIKQGA